MAFFVGDGGHESAASLGAPAFVPSIRACVRSFVRFCVNVSAPLICFDVSTRSQVFLLVAEDELGLVVVCRVSVSLLRSMQLSTRVREGRQEGWGGGSRRD